MPSRGSEGDSPSIRLWRPPEGLAGYTHTTPRVDLRSASPGTLLVQGEQMLAEPMVREIDLKMLPKGTALWTTAPTQTQLGWKTLCFH